MSKKIVIIHELNDAADDYYKNEMFYNQLGEEQEIKVITLLKNYRKVKQR